LGPHAPRDTTGEIRARWPPARLQADGHRTRAGTGWRVAFPARVQAVLGPVRDRLLAARPLEPRARAAVQRHERSRQGRGARVLEAAIERDTTMKPVGHILTRGRALLCAGCLL